MITVDLDENLVQSLEFENSDVLENSEATRLESFDLYSKLEEAFNDINSGKIKSMKKSLASIRGKLRPQYRCLLEGVNYEI